MIITLKGLSKFNQAQFYFYWVVDRFWSEQNKLYGSDGLYFVSPGFRIDLKRERKQP